jgi:hypothetical protein
MDDKRIDSNDKKCECVFFLVSLRIPAVIARGAALWLHEDPVAAYLPPLFSYECVQYSIMYNTFSSLLMYHISFVQAFFL